MPLDLFRDLAVALAIGFAVGVERGWRERDIVEGGRTAGIRTYALSGLLGGITGLLSLKLGAWALAAIGLPFGAAFTLFKWREGDAEHDVSVTAVVAALVVFALGAYAVVGDWRLASAAGAAGLALLAFRTVLHNWLKAISWEELRSALILLAMTFIVLPLLPDQDLGPYGAFNPYQLWLLTIGLAAVSFLGYVAIRVFGAGSGMLVAAAIGAVISSTAVVLDLARRTAKSPELVLGAAAGAILAGAVMAARVGLIASALSPVLALRIAPALIAYGVISVAIVVAMSLRRQRPPAEAAPLKSPLDFAQVARFAALLAVITAAARIAAGAFGPKSLLALAAVAGLADVDALTLTVGRMIHSGLAVKIAAEAILLAAAANGVGKSVIALVVGGRRFALIFAAAGVVATAGAAAVFFLAPLP